MSGIVIQNLAFALTQKKLVVSRVDRKDLPHLTISWGNRSGEIDIHLTPAFPKDENDRESLAKIQEAVAGSFIESIGKDIAEVAKNKMFRIIWGIRPGVLARNHYYLIGTKGESIEQWLRRSATKLRGKYRLDSNVLKKIPKTELYYPTARRLIELEQQGQLYAVCTKGSEKGNLLAMIKFPWHDGSITWIALIHEDMLEFTKTLRKVLSMRFKDLASNQVKRVYQVLKLKEIGW
jgi:hypothetical protein